jgi:hypothetical protein
MCALTRCARAAMGAIVAPFVKIMHPLQAGNKTRRDIKMIKRLSGLSERGAPVGAVDAGRGATTPFRGSSRLLLWKS